MKLTYRLISVSLLSLPPLSVVLAWGRLPLKVPVHFGPDRHPDQFSSREEWFMLLLVSLFFFNLIRALILRAVSRQRHLKPGQYEALFLLTAGFVAGVLSLMVLQGVCRLPMYADWMPVLFFLSGSGFIYVSFPPVCADLPEELKAQATTNQLLARRLVLLQYRQTLSRLVVVRVNLLAVGLMFFVDRSDRWSVGILANGLAYACLFILAAVGGRRPV